MNESLLQYAWQCKLFKMNMIYTVDNDPIEIIDVGQLNHDAGPDFFNAKIRIGETIWAGNIEIHVLASDWYRHHHEKDKRYDSIILHVVGESDIRVQRTNGEIIPQLQLQLNEDVKRKYEILEQSTHWIRCGTIWGKADPTLLSFQLSRTVRGRIHRKSREILSLLEQNKNDWASTFYQILLKGFGMHTNSLPFELLGKSLPLRVLAKQKSDLMDIEALLFGQAGLLCEGIDDNYKTDLTKRYQYLRHKYELSPIEGNLWRYGKMRPSNFPHIKIAQFAVLIHKSEHLFSKLKECNQIEMARELLQCETSKYWNKHYLFGKESPTTSKHMDKHTIDSLIINTVIPTLFVYGEKHKDESLQEKMLKWLEELPAENNNITKGWREIGQPVNNAYESQALLELKTQYCDLNKCLRCGIGHHLLST